MGTHPLSPWRAERHSCLGNSSCRENGRVAKEEAGGFMSALDLIRGNKTERKPKAPRPKCKLCGETVGNYLGAIPMPMQLADHLQRQHPEEYAKGLALNAAFPQFLICCAFEIHDPKLLQDMETTRAILFALV